LEKKYKGILYIILSAFCFAVMNTMVRLSGDLPSVQKSFFRNLIAFIFALVILLKNKTGFSMQKGSLKYFILRSLFGTIGILCNFYAVDHLVLSDASMLNKMSPFFVLLFSWIILGERLSWKQAVIVLTAFLGSLLIIKPTFVNMDLFPALIGLCGGICAGIAYTMVRILGQRGEKGPFIVCFFSGFSCLVTLPYLLFCYAPMTWQQVLILLGAGFAAAGGQFAITAAYVYAPAKEISVYDYSQIIFSAVIGYVLFHQMPDQYSILGYIIITSMALAMFFLNRRQ
jgi:drug/metabolite transporter (DMT)-like permease